MNNILPLIVCVSETHLTSEKHNSEIHVAGYQCVWVDSHSRHTGGLQMYIKNDVEDINVKENIIEKNCWLLNARNKIYEKYFRIVCVYHSPSSNDSVFLNFFEDWCNKFACNASLPLIITGDFNINWDSNDYYSNKLKQYTQEIGLNQRVCGTTREYFTH